MAYGNRDKPESKSGRVGSWKGDSTSCDVDGTKRQTSARRVRCPNKSASGNPSDQNDPHPGNRR